MFRVNAIFVCKFDSFPKSNKLESVLPSNWPKFPAHPLSLQWVGGRETLGARLFPTNRNDGPAGTRLISSDLESA